MKTVLIYLFFFIFPSFAIAENEVIITGRFVAKESIKIEIFEPVFGYFNSSHISTNENCRVINSDSFHYKIEINAPITLLVFITTKKEVPIEKSIIIAFPGDSIHLVIDLTDININSLQYAGSNAIGQKLMNDIEYEPVSKYLPVFELLSKIKENKFDFISNANEIIFNTTRKFDSLYQKRIITLEFTEYYKVMFTQQLYEQIISKFLHNYKEREVFTKYERDSIIATFYKIQPVTHPYCKSTYNSILYIDAYYNFIAYLKLGLKSIEPLMENRVYNLGTDKLEIGNFCGQYLYITDNQMKEDLWAFNLFAGISFGSPTPIIETINQFYQIFPNSRWKTFIDKKYSKKLSGKTFEYVLSMPINYVDTLQNIKTLKSLFNELPFNKPIFVDIWASWCGPCILAFQANKELDSFLIAKNIEHLYICLDNQGSNKGWTASVTKYKLGGHHIIANEFLINEIKNIYKLDRNNGIEIPKYILVNKEKNIVLKNATSPIDFDTLKKEIIEHLLK